MLNRTGMHDTGEYNLGRGICYFAFLINDLPTSFRDVGNVTEFNLNIETETLEHKSSRQGLAVVDKEIVISQKMTLNITFDSISDQNMSLFLSGETSNQDIASATDVVAAATSIFRKLENIAGTITETDFEATDLPFWFDIYRDKYGEGGSANLTRLYNLDATSWSNTKIEGCDDAEANPVALTEDTHYTVDRTMGRVFINEAGIAALAAGTGTSRIRTLAAQTIAPAADTAIDEVQGLKTTAASIAVKFIGENPANDNRKIEYQFHKVKLRSEGDFPLIGDEFTTGQLTGTAEENTTADANSPYVTVRSYDNS